MLWVKFNTHVIDHERLLDAGPQARDLYVWGMLYAGKHETDGELPMIAVMASAWGIGGKANVKAAARLVDVGLWERTDTGFKVLKWSAQGNQTTKSLAAKREAGRLRKERYDAARNAVTNAVSNAKGSTSTSLSVSESRSPEPKQIEIASGPPGWWDGACDATAMAIGGEVADRSALWVQYLASRGRKSWDMNHNDAVGWIAAVVRSERARVRAGPVRSRGAEITKQPTDPDAPWMKLPEVRR